MKIVHISASAPYNDYWGYQDNLLPKYQHKMGYEVTIITTNKAHQDGKIVEVPCDDYVLSDGVRVIRHKQKQYPIRFLTGLRSQISVYKDLVELAPDLIFFHGLSSATIVDAVKYKRNNNPKCVIVQDNHLDYNIGLKFATLKEKIIRAYHRWMNSRTINYVDRVYGVTPWRKLYAEDYFRIPSDKTDVLIMGADDEKIDFENRESLRENIRNANNVDNNDFLVVTGGKIDARKKIDVLMQAVAGMEGVKLLVFGNIEESVKKKCEEIIRESNNVIYIGWINSDDVYKYFFAADLVVFPGQHSVLWEQACAAKVPCVFEKWDGMEHVNNGGNSDFIAPITIDMLREKIVELQFSEKYWKMKAIAQSKKTDIYLYSEIAKKSVESIMK